jgi:hypothetical protein
MHVALKQYALNRCRKIPITLNNQKQDCMKHEHNIM